MVSQLGTAARRRRRGRSRRGGAVFRKLMPCAEQSASREQQQQRVYTQCVIYASEINHICNLFFKTVKFYNIGGGLGDLVAPVRPFSASLTGAMRGMSPLPSLTRTRGPRHALRPLCADGRRPRRPPRSCSRRQRLLVTCPCLATHCRRPTTRTTHRLPALRRQRTHGMPAPLAAIAAGLWGGGDLFQAGGDLGE